MIKYIRRAKGKIDQVYLVGSSSLTEVLKMFAMHIRIIVTFEIGLDSLTFINSFINVENENKVSNAAL